MGGDLVTPPHPIRTEVDAKHIQREEKSERFSEILPPFSRLPYNRLGMSTDPREKAMPVEAATKLLLHVLGARQKLVEEQYKYGPYRLLLDFRYEELLESRYFETSSLKKSVRERLLELEGITEIRFQAISDDIGIELIDIHDR